MKGINLHKCLSTLLLLGAMFLISCNQKLDKPKVRKDVVAVDGCRHSKFFGTVLDKENLKNLFVCLGWEKELPNFYQKLSEFDQASWDTLVSPFNKAFFENSRRDERSKFFNLIYRADEIGLLKKLDELIREIDLLEVINLLEKVVECDGKCSEEDLNEFIHFLPTDDAYVYFLILFNELNRQVQDQESISTQKLVNLINDQTLQEAVSIALSSEDSVAFDPIAISEFLPLAEEFIFDSSLYRSHMKDWLENQRKFLNTDLINNLEDVFYDSRVLAIYNGVLSCESPRLKIDAKPVLGSLLQKSFINGREQFFREVLDSGILLKLTSTICPDFKAIEGDFLSLILDGQALPEFKNHELNLENMNHNFLVTLKNPAVYDLGKKAYYLFNKNQSKLTFDKLFHLMNKTSLTYFHEIGIYLAKTHTDLITSSGDFLAGSSRKFYFAQSKLISLMRKNTPLHNKMKRVLSKLNEDDIFLLFKLSSKLFGVIEHPKELMGIIYDFIILSKELPALLESDWASSVRSLSLTQNTIKEVKKIIEDPKANDELQKLLSSEYILKAVRLLSRGVDAGEIDFSDSTISSVTLPEKTIIDSMTELMSSETEQIYADCLTSLSLGKDVFSVVRHMPSHCQHITSGNKLFRVYKSLAFFEQDFSMFGSVEKPYAFFDGKGLITAKGMGSGLSLIAHYYQQKNKIEPFSFEAEARKFQKVWRENPEVEDILSFTLSIVDDFFSVKSSGVREWRNDFLRKYIAQSNYKNIDVHQYTSILIDDLSRHVKNYSFNFDQETHQSCDEYFSNPVGHSQCPQLDEVASRVRQSVQQLNKVNQPKRPKAITQMLKASIPHQGIQIPFEADKTKNKVFQLDQFLHFVVDTNDKDFKTKSGRFLNRKKVKYYYLDRNNNRKYRWYEMTVGQRIETTMREVRLKKNFLGAVFMNTVSRAENYYEEVKDNLKLLKRCSGLRFCMRWLSSKDITMVKNGIETYPALWEIESHFGHGKLMQSLMTAIISSSHSDATKANYGGFIPRVPPDSTLNRHNGIILTQLSMLSGTSNLYRLLDTSFGGPEGIREYLESNDFKQIYSGFLRGVDFRELDRTYQSIFNKILQVRDDLGDDLINKAVNLVGNFTPEESKLAQGIFHDFLFISSFLGSEDVVFSKDDLEVSARYAGNNVGVVFKFADEFIDLWPQLMKLFEGEEKLEYLKLTKFWTQYLRNGLSSQNHETKLAYYNIVNEGVYSLRQMFESYPRAETSGIQVLRDFIIQKSEQVKMSVDNILSMVNDLQKRHSKEKIAEKIEQISSEFKLLDKGLFNQNVANIIEGINYTTFPMFCTNLTSCEVNPHYDEPSRLVSYAMLTDEDGILNVRYFFDWLTEETIIPMAIMMDEMIPGIKVE